MNGKLFKIDNILIPAKNFENNDDFLKSVAAKKLGIPPKNIGKIILLKKSMDARRKENLRYNVSLAVGFCGNKRNLTEYIPRAPLIIEKTSKKFASPPVITGFGPAGIFSALILARAGANPVVIEQGEDVETRKADVNAFWEKRILNPLSNVQFGEGGAGTFSDGKLTTGIKSPYIRFILEEFIKHGAPAEILYEAKPHIGTDLLCGIIKNIREEIISLGGRIIFGAMLTDFTHSNNSSLSVIYKKDSREHEIEANSLILAIGHSSRETFDLLYKKGLALTAKPFSAGIRIEHLQSEINRAMYGEFNSNIKLPPANYKLAVKTTSGRGVYTFCMCPGGYVAASASEPETVVTNGMSLHSRGGENANSAVLVNVLPSDFMHGCHDKNPLAGMFFQREIERRAFIAGGSDYNAPFCTSGNFIGGKKCVSEIIPTYKPAVKYALPDEYLPPFITEALREAIPLFGKKIMGFDTPEAVLTGPETRSSSPVRIERGNNKEAVNYGGVYPCGEGAGYAGGIMSAAADGIETAMKIIEKNSLSFTIEKV